MTTLCKEDRTLWPVRVALVFGYFGYLRVSNLAPDVAANFDIKRNTTWADVSPTEDGLIINLKWTKTLQARRGVAPVPLAALKDKTVCPVKAWEDYTSLFPKMEDYENIPLLLSTGYDKGKPITIPKLRAMFHRVTSMAGLAGKGYTPHSLRRGGATHSFQQGIPIQNIKQHGTWESDAVERYLLRTPRLETPVAKGFANMKI